MGMRKFSILWVLIVLVFFSGCVTIYNPATGRNETYFIDEDTEIQLGRNFAGEILKETPQVTDVSVVNKVRSIGYRVSRDSDRPDLEYNFYVLEDKTINAFALPGGYIFVNKGLVDAATEDELAFVIGHEIGHVCARHGLKRLQIGLGYDLLITLALGKSQYADTRAGLNLVYNFVALGFSRQDEYLADSLGVDYAYRAGYNPEGAIGMLQKLKIEAQKKGGETFVYFSSHPPIDERIKKVKEEIIILKNLQ